MSREVRVRFAPSPTGPLHIGGVRTALYNYLAAKGKGGKFILRIEDTDQTRFVEGAEEYITESLEWLGLEPDESPSKGGDFGPYRQSERKEIYKQYADQLVGSDLGYIAFDTSEELEAMRARLEADGETRPQYNHQTRMSMRNSLTLSSAEVDDLINSGAPYVIRIKIPESREIVFEDVVRGEVKVNTAILDDKVLLKSDGMPTYHLANVVDDRLMEISHVIRGEEWLPSAPLHVLMYEYFGWSDHMPQFAHLPLILKPDGKGKLSKRDSEKSGIPIFPLEWKDPASGELLIGFREEGYLPEAVLNFLVMLGWNPGTEEELFSLEELKSEFALNRIIKGGARFDINKANWYNEQYLRKFSNEELGQVVKSVAEAKGYTCSDDLAQSVGELMRERVTFPSQLVDEAEFIFIDPQQYDEKVVRKKWTQEAVDALMVYATELKSKEEIASEEAKNTLEKLLEKRDSHLGKIMQPLRVALTGKAGGPDLMEIIALLGPSKSAERIESAVRLLPVKQQQDGQ